MKPWVVVHTDIKGNEVVIARRPNKKRATDIFNVYLKGLKATSETGELVMLNPKGQIARRKVVRDK